jgi:cystathionine beta-lyase/cystathionine gamma-synthase
VIRVSIGLEDMDDIKDDLRQALARLAGTTPELAAE